MSNGRKVVFVNRYYAPDLSATSQMLTDLAERLAAAGVSVHVICSQQLYEDANARLPDRERIRGVEVHRVKTARFGRASLRGRALDYGSFYLTATARLGSLLRRGDVAVIKTDPPLLSVFAAGVVTFRGARLINWLQDVFPEVAGALGVMRLPRSVNRALCHLRDRSLHAAVANVVLGTRMRDLFRDRGIDSHRLHIIENWADGDALVPRSPAQSEFRARLGLDRAFVVGYSGNLGRAHEFDTMLQAAELLREEPDVRFLIVGGGAKTQQLRKAAEDRGLSSFQFEAYQPREALADSMAAADVHLACLLPEMEGLIVPSKVYGILAAGRPAIFIGDRRSEVGTMLEESRCGFGVACGDGARLARLIREMRDDPRLTASLGREARATFERHFTLDRAVRKWLELLSDVPELAQSGTNSPSRGMASAAKRAS